MCVRYIDIRLQMTIYNNNLCVVFIVNQKKEKKNDKKKMKKCTFSMKHLII